MPERWDQNPEFREVSFREIWNSKLGDLASGSPFTKLIIYGAILILIVIVVFKSFFLVQAGEEGVVRRFGKYTSSKSAGFHTRIPFIDRVDIVDVENVETLEFGFRTEKAGISTQYSQVDYPEESEMLTGDMNIIDIDFAIQYRIQNARNFLFNVRNPIGTLKNASEASMRQLTGDRGFDEIRHTRNEIETEVREKIQKLMDDYGTGILISYVKLQHVKAPEKVMSAWNAVNKAEQYKDEMKNLADQKYNEALPKARGQAIQIIKKADAYRIQRVNRAQGEKEKFLSILEEYNQAQEITRRRIFLETMETILTQISEKIIIDHDVSNSILNLLNLEGK